MAPTSKLLKMLVKNNILQLHKAAQKPDKGYAYFFFPTFKIEEAESQRSPAHPTRKLPSCHKELDPLQMCR